jgi:cytidine deaminase
MRERDSQLRELATSAARDLASPAISGHHVGAAVLTRSGGIFRAGNIESPSNLFNLCAERAAIVVALESEGPSMRIDTIAAYSAEQETLTPCGACRQLIHELGADARVLQRAAGSWVTTTVAELLPLAYDFEGGAT